MVADSARREMGLDVLSIDGVHKQSSLGQNMEQGNCDPVNCVLVDKSG